MTTIFVIDEKTGKVARTCAYSVSPKKAIVNYIMQYIKNNWSTWQYPEYIEGIRQSIKAPDRYYYDDIANGKIIAAYPDNEYTAPGGRSSISDKRQTINNGGVNNDHS